MSSSLSSRSRSSSYEPIRTNSKETPKQRRYRKSEANKLAIHEITQAAREKREEKREDRIEDRKKKREQEKREREERKQKLHEKQASDKLQRKIDFEKKLLDKTQKASKNGGGIRKTRKHIKKRKGKTYRRCAKKNGKKTRKN